MSRRLFRWEPDEKIRGKAKLWAIAALIPFLLLGAWELSHGRMLRQINHDFQMMNERVPPEAIAAPTRPPVHK